MLIKDINLTGISRLSRIRFNENPQASRKDHYNWEEIRKFSTKNSIKLTQFLIKKYSNIGGHVCDPMDGIGTTLIESILLDRNGYSFNISKDRINTVLTTIDAIQHSDMQRKLGFYKNIYAPGQLITEYIPRFMLDLVLFSPPYGTQCHNMGKASKQIALQKSKSLYSCQEYLNDPDWDKWDVSLTKNLKDHFIMMRPILGGSCECLKNGGFIVLILQDYIRQGVPVGLVQGYVDELSAIEGMYPVGFYDREVPVTLFKQMQLAKGNNVIGIEHTIVFMKDVYRD